MDKQNLYLDLPIVQGFLGPLVNDKNNNNGYNAKVFAAWELTNPNFPPGRPSGNLGFKFSSNAGRSLSKEGLNIFALILSAKAKANNAVSKGI